MPSYAAVYKVGDTAPAFRYVLTNDDGTPINLTAVGDTATLTVTDGAGNPVVTDAAVTEVDAANGIVSFQWAATHLTSAGTYEADFEVTRADGTVQSVPDDRNLLIRVVGGPGE